MKHFISSVAVFLLSAVLAAPAFAQGGMGDGPGTPGSKGPNKGPETPGGGGGGGGGGSEKKEEPKAAKAQIDSMEIFLRFLPTDLKSCDAIEKALQKIPTVKKIAVTPGEAKMVFTGNWDQLIAVQNAAPSVKLKGALITPGIFTVDCAPGRANPSTPTPAEALQKVQGVNKAFGEGMRVTVFGSVALIDPRHFDTTLKEYGWKFVAVRSHRLRTLSYEAWEKGIRPEKIKERLLKVPGVLRCDVDAGASTVTLLIIRETSKDLEIVTAAEDVMVTVYPGKAEEEDETGSPPPAK
jgi:hypothetical protein